MKMLAGQSKLLLFCVCIVIVCCYWAGTTGGFILDDVASLEQLGYHNKIDSIEKLQAYVFGGITGPGGRPVALLTFVANAQTWPADPYYFIVTNIAIHVVNTVLLYWFLSLLFATALPALKNKNAIVIMACALWALHPFHASTVLYIVQRMTSLAATFSLLTFIAYLYARRDLQSRRYLMGAVRLGGGGLAAALGFLSKETVVLLPLQLLLIEFLCSVNNGAKRDRALKGVIWCCLVPTAVLVIGYPAKMVVANAWHFITAGAELGSHRSFTMFERLLTEQRVLGNYLLDLLLPKMQSPGVFYDNYKISTSLFNPISTLLWFFVHAGLLIGSLFFCKRTPLLFFCVWWFYLGHLMESTVPMLEIKFDHRNYLPSIGLLLLLAGIICSLKSSRLKKLISAGILLVYAILLYMAASLWGKPLTAAMVWVEKSPDSPRALEHAASLHLTAYGAGGRVENLLQRSIQAAPKVDAELKFMGVFCKTYNNEPIDWRNFAARVQSSERDWSLYPTLEKILDNYVNKKCPELDLTGYLSVVHAYQNNPVYLKTNSYYLMDDLAIKAALAFDMPDLAKEYADKANEKLVPLAFQMNRALYFANKGDVLYAVGLLERAIAIASYSNNETDFTMINAQEILQLMQDDLKESINEQ
jgi:hypothetical protein